MSQIAFKQSTNTRITATKNWDLAHEISEFASRIGLRSSEDEAVMRVSDSTISRAEIRLTSVSSTANSTVVSSSAYQLNSANQRVAVTNADGSYWVYGYDNLGQVTSGKKYWSDNTPVAGQQFEYTFDDIGNRTQMGTSIEGCKCHGMCL